jgi:hypothetical protein
VLQRIVANVASDIYSRVGAPVGASISADIATNATSLGTLTTRIPSTLTITSGKVDVNDKTGFSLSQSFPSNFASMSISVGGAVTAGTVSDKTGYALTSGEHTNIATDTQTGMTAQGYTTTRAGYLDALNGLVQAIWDKATSALTVVGSIGKLLVTNIDAAISSRSSYDGSDTSGTTTLLSRLTSGRATGLDNLDTNVGSRLAQTSYAAPDNTSITAIKAQTDKLNFTGTDVKATLDGESVTVDADAIADAVLAGLGSVADPLLNLVPGSYDSGTAGAALGRLVAASVTITAPVYASGRRIRIVRGDDYLATDGRALDFSSADWPDLTSATINFTAKRGSNVLTKAGTVVTATGTKVVRIELEHTDTEDLKITEDNNPYIYDIEATLSNDSIVTLVDSGKMTVVADQTT